ncbi:MAG: flagellar basal-body rod protein FlgF [Alphaproteobacteria bacterium]
MESTAIIALSKQSVVRRKMSVIANNLANMNTTGFKGEKLMFIEHLVRSKGGTTIGGDKLRYVRDIATYRDLAEGPMAKTGNPLDLAISGDGFFVIGTGGGDRYTRGGNLQLDEEGQLVTRQGDPILSEDGDPFFFSPQDKNIDIAKDGTVSTENGTIGKLAVVTFENPQDMRIIAGGLYSTQQAPKELDEMKVMQGMLEQSNVNPIIEMTRMIQVSRSYASTKSFIEKEDERMKKTIQEYARPA